MRQVAKELNVPLIDLNVMSKTFYEALGPEKSKLAFKDGDGTHHNNYGSTSWPVASSKASGRTSSLS
ncbi:MAG TPA: hypothetical protein VF779_11815 [Pyrinomonadaceae bacterium]